jgi:hypothetical protein
MRESTPTSAATETAPNPPFPNPAVQRCCEAFERSLEESRANGQANCYAEEDAEGAYLSAIPHLSGYENIRDFIACVTHGMVIGAIDYIEGPKLLYAAQIAIGALRHEPRAQKACPPPPTYW